MTQAQLETLVMDALDTYSNQLLINSSTETVRELLFEDVASEVATKDVSVKDIYTAVNSVISE